MSRLRAARTALAAVSVLLGLAVAPVDADNSPQPAPSAILGDNFAHSGTVNPSGVGSLPYNESGAANGGTNIGLGAQRSGSSGPAQYTGPVVPAPACIPGLSITGTWQIPPLKIDSDPPVDSGAAQTGLVGMPTWFWNPSYDGTVINSQNISGTVTTCDQNDQPHTVPVILELHAWPISYTWDFGDGSPPVTGRCGQATVEATCPPGALGQVGTPNVLHTYELSSPDASGYQVSLDVQFGVSITGQGTFFLQPAPEHAELLLPVRQVQSILVPVTQP